MGQYREGQTPAMGWSHVLVLRHLYAIDYLPISTDYYSSAASGAAPRDPRRLGRSIRVPRVLVYNTFPRTNMHELSGRKVCEL